LARPIIGLALGSGGARGWCHIGVLRALQEIGIAPDLIAGTSIGAVVGAAYAGGRLDALEDWASRLSRTRMMTYLDISPKSGGLIAGKQIARLVAALDLPQRIEDLSLPFAAVSTDFETGAEVWLQKGCLVDAIRASSAIPGVISPYLLDGRWHMDGGIVNPVPVSLCRAMGADVVIAVDPDAHMTGRRLGKSHSAATGASHLLGALPQALRKHFHFAGEKHGRHAPPAPHYFDVVYTAIEIISDRVRASRLAGDPPHVLLSADLQHIPTLDLFLAAPAIAEGHRITHAQSGWIGKYASGTKAPHPVAPDAPDAT